MNPKILLYALICFMFIVTPAFATFDYTDKTKMINLTYRETAGVARTNEPIVINITGLNTTGGLWLVTGKCLDTNGNETGYGLMYNDSTSVIISSHIPSLAANGNFSFCIYYGKSGGAFVTNYTSYVAGLWNFNNYSIGTDMRGSMGISGNSDIRGMNITAGGYYGKAMNITNAYTSAINSLAMINITLNGYVKAWFYYNKGGNYRIDHAIRTATNDVANFPYQKGLDITSYDSGTSYQIWKDYWTSGCTRTNAGVGLTTPGLIWNNETFYIDTNLDYGITYHNNSAVLTNTSICPMTNIYGLSIDLTGTTSVTLLDEFIISKNLEFNTYYPNPIYDSFTLSSSMNVPASNNPPVAIIYNLSTGYYYRSLNLPFKFEGRDTENTTLKINATLNGISFYYNASYTNSTNISMTVNITNPGDYNYTLWVQDGMGLNSTDYQLISIYSYNITDVNYTIQGIETNYTEFNITFQYNPDIIVNITSAFYYNGVNYGFYDSNITNGTHIKNIKSIVIPLIPANSTSRTLYFKNNITFTNGTVINQNSNNYVQTVITAFNNRGLNKNQTHIPEGRFVSFLYNMSSLMPLSNNYRNITAIVNITFNNSVYPMVFYYNNTYDYVWNVTVIAPNITAFNYTLPYNATINLTDSSGSRLFSTIGYIIYVDNQAFDTNCSIGPNSINFTFYDEDLPTIPINNSNSMEIDITAWDENNTFLGYFSFAFNGSQTYTFCISPEYAILNVNATIVYRANNYYQRNYYLINAPLSSSTVLLNLYLLNSTYYGLARIYVESVLGEPYENGYVNIEKYYPESAAGTSGAYKTVAMVKTADVTGDAYTYLKYYDAYYRFIVQNGQTVLKTFSQRQIVKENSYDTYANVLLRMDVIDSEYYNYIGNELITYSCSASNITGIVSCDYADVSGLTSSVNMTVRKYTSGFWVDVCSQKQTSSSGLLFCNISSQGNGTYFYLLNVYTYQGNSYYPDGSSGTIHIGVYSGMGQAGLFIVLIIFLVLTMIGVYSGSFNFTMIMSCVSLIMGFLIIGDIVLVSGGVISLIFVVAVLIYKRGNN